MKISKDMLISDLLQVDSSIMYFLMQIGMHCVTCPAAMGETLAEASVVHGLDPDSVEEYLINTIKEKLEDEEEERKDREEEAKKAAAAESTEA
ncbi:MAG: DUF1858 domain-containing protein [Lachnospiraceae bacterium]|nr:DUF1858 domain-containing protein [Lachnospiraceae bacterium]